MKCTIVFASLLIVVLSQPLPYQNDRQEDLDYLLYEDENGKIQVEYLVDVPTNLTASDSDVTYYFFSQSNPQTGIEIDSNNMGGLTKTTFDVKKETMFIIHGWKNNHESDVNSLIRETILKYYDINIFVVDWSPVAAGTYVVAQVSQLKRIIEIQDRGEGRPVIFNINKTVSGGGANGTSNMANVQGSVRQIGEYVANFVKSVQSSYGLQLDKLRFVGHSLGAHVCGCAGAALNGQVELIVGLDPAGPLFLEINKDNRLDFTDAKFVQIIHTNGGKLGYFEVCGDSDYYPNGGQSQPGCGVDVTGACCHSRSYQYYAESIASTQFIAQKCSSFSDYTSGTCQGAKSSMGMFNMDKGAAGAYYLQTNSASPFAKG